MVNVKFDLRQLDTKGKCICCGEIINRKDKKVFVITAHKSQVYQITICQDCINRLYEFEKYGD